MSIALLLVLAALVVAGTSAARSTWSPCGLSMLSSITPFTEHGRGHRYGWTAGWFVAGAAAGGACLGGIAALIALAVSLVGPSTAVVGAVGGAAALAGAGVDAGAFGGVLPLIRRQVDDRWLRKYRAWVYGAGFGWQIGFGFATYVMSAGIVVLVVLAGLTGSPLTAELVATGFGLARGLTVFLTLRCDSPDRLRTLHQRLDRAGSTVRWAAAGVQAAAGSALIASAVAPGTGAACPWWVGLIGPPLVLIATFMFSTIGGAAPSRFRSRRLILFGRLK